MTKTSVKMLLREKMELANSIGLSLELDEEDMVLFYREAKEHRDYVFFKGSETNGGWKLEQCFDPDSGTVNLTRAWYTPKEAH